MELQARHSSLYTIEGHYQHALKERSLLRIPKSICLGFNEVYDYLMTIVISRSLPLLPMKKHHF